MTMMDLKERADLQDEKFDSRPSSLASPEESKQLYRAWYKIDRRVLPTLAVIHILSVIDKSNLGNARVAGFQKDVGLTDKQFTIALTVTSLGLIAAQLPTNLLLRIIGPNIVLPFIATIWGMITAIQSVVKSYDGLLACRFFLGLMEGGINPAIVLYLSDFYPRLMLQKRVAIVLAPTTLSNAISGLLAYVIVRMDGLGSHRGWEWIFILEGTFTVLVGIVSFFFLPRALEHCKFLSQEEKDWVAAKTAESNHEKGHPFEWKEVRMAFQSPHVWAMVFSDFIWGAIGTGLSYFTPSIIFGLGYSGINSNLMTVPPFAAGFLYIMAIAYVSDRYGCRGYISIFCSITAAIGFSMFLASTSLKVQYGSLFLSVAGSFGSACTIATWISNNSAPHVRRATALAMVYFTQHAGGILSTWLYGGVLSKPPRYTAATRIVLIFCALGFLAASVNLAWLKWQNHKKEKKRKTMVREQEQEGLGDRSAWFIYTL